MKTQTILMSVVVSALALALTAGAVDEYPSLPVGMETMEKPTGVTTNIFLSLDNTPLSLSGVNATAAGCTLSYLSGTNRIEAVSAKDATGAIRWVSASDPTKNLGDEKLPLGAVIRYTKPKEARAMTFGGAIALFPKK